MSITLGTKTKDPSAVKDYSVDWEDWLATGDTLSTVTWTVSGTGLTTSTPTNSDTVASVYLSGGTAGLNYTVACKVTTTDGRTDERTFRIRVRNL